MSHQPKGMERYCEEARNSQQCKGCGAFRVARLLLKHRK
ncbi:hypothetical protein TSMEX_011003 [Taenia solium]|eukprot:TsM_000353200 transcript=TsM_000353200 gene=TsM_000353200